MNLRLLFAILRSRALLIFLTLAVAVGAAAALTFTQAKKYTASTSMVLNFEQDTPFDTGTSSMLPAQLSSTYLETQLDIVRSQKVARKVVDMEKLDQDAGWKQAYKDAGVEGTPLRDWIAQMIAENVDAEPLQNSRVVTLTYEATTPEAAARMANAYAQAFMATTLELNVEPARRNAQWFDDQLKVLRKRLESARARMTDFQVQKGIVALDEKLSAETMRLDDISRNLVEAQMATSAARARQLGVNHPDYVSAVQREGALRASLESQKSNILQLKGQRDQLDMLSNEVETEQQNYSAALQAYYRNAMQSQFNQTNIALLSPAVTPSDPSSPNILLNMASAVVLGLFLGFVVAVLAEMISPRLPATARSRAYVGETLTEL